MSSQSRGRKRKRASVPPPVAPPVRSLRRARQITSQFHLLEQQLSRLKEEGANGGEEELSELEREVARERRAYQDASKLTTSQFRTSRWVLRQLDMLGLRPSRGQAPLPTLEVGAINTQLLGCSWLQVRAIDLESRHARIEELDFFALPPRAEFAVVVNSMVINCVPTAAARGEMLRRCRDHLRPGGHLFLMLPRLCLMRSPYITPARMQRLLRMVGFSLVLTHQTPRVAFYCLQRPQGTAELEESDLARDFPLPPPVVQRGPKLRSEFAIGFAAQTTGSEAVA